MRVLAVDPGYEVSAWVLFGTDGQRVIEHGIAPNEKVLEMFSILPYDVAVFEQVESFGMAVGKEVFETVFWTGRMFEAAREYCVPERMPRRVVKQHLCYSARATDSNIRVALMDRFGGSKAAAIGTKAQQGPLYGVKSHAWAGLAIAVTWSDQHPEERTPA
jgi:hypothetical protein